MTLWNSVHGLEDGENVDAATFNRPLAELAARTEYLKEQLERGRQDDASIRLTVALSEKDTPNVGDIVCLDLQTKRYIRAVAAMSLYDAYTASERAFALGMLVSKNGFQGIVAIYGRVDLTNFDVTSMVEEGVFENGQYYLSSAIPGKITRHPSGPKVSLGLFTRVAQGSGSLVGDFAVLNPQYMDIEAHTHRTYALLARPCGESVNTDEYYPEDVVAELGANTVSVIGYPPVGGELVSEDPETKEKTYYTPRLVVGGDWTSSESEEYEIIVTGATEAEAPTTWPCYVRWRVLGSQTYNRGVLRFFGDEIPVGDKGMTIRLEPSGNMSEKTPFLSRQDMTSEHWTWKVGRDSGRGWSKFDINRHAELQSGAIVRLSGSPDMSHGIFRLSVPRKIFKVFERDNPNSSSESFKLKDGYSVVIDGTEYKISTSADELDNAVSPATSVFETWVGLRALTPAVYYDTRMVTRSDDKTVEVGSVFVMADTVVIRDTDGVDHTPPCVVDNTDATAGVQYAVVTDENGKSYAQLRPVNMTPNVSAIPANRFFEVFPLNNELSLLLVGDKKALSFEDATEIEFTGVPGAVFRYNIEYDNDLKLHYPPVPRQSGSLMLNGVEISAYDQYSQAVAIFTGESLYWRDNQAGRQPWPYPVMTVDTIVPVEDEYREIFHFISSFQSDTGPVMSLHVAEGSPITVTRCGTDEAASIGDLELGLDLALNTLDKEVQGHKVVKGTRNGQLLLGPVVEKLIAGPGITFSRNGETADGQGTFTISADGSTYSGDFETVALENAKIDSAGMFPYIRFLRWTDASSTPSGFTAKFHVPATAVDAVYRVRFYATVFGETSFSGDDRQTAGISLDYNILPDYSSEDGSEEVETTNLKSGLIRPDTPFVLNIPFGCGDDESGYSYTAFDPMLIHNDATIPDVAGKSARVLRRAFPYPEDCGQYFAERLSKGKTQPAVFGLRPGYTVAVRLTRTSPTGAGVVPYVGPVGILNLRWTIEQVATLDEVQAESLTRTVINTVTNLRKVAQISGRMDNSVQVVTILKRLLNALS